LESQKIRMVDTLYSKSTLAGTKFLESFQKAMNELDYMEDYQITSEEAQKILRGENSVTVIQTGVRFDPPDHRAIGNRAGSKETDGNSQRN